MLRVDINQDTLPPITIGLYRAFLAKGKIGKDALAVYQHLLFTYRLQHTNIVRAENVYLMKGLSMSEHRVKKAKTLLRSMELIGTVWRHTAKGRFVNPYLKLNLLPNPGINLQSTKGAKSAPLENLQSIEGAPIARAATADKCLKKKSKCLEQGTALVRSKTHARAKNPEYMAFLHNFRGLYKEKTGAALPWNYGKDGALLKADLKEHGADRLTRAARLFFSGDCPQAVRRFSEGKGAGYSYGVFRSQLRRGLFEVLDAEDRRLRLLKTCKACGKQSDTTGIDCPKCGEPDAYQVREARRA